MLSLRVKKLISLEHSLQFIVRLPETDVNSETVKWIGWEPNNKGKFLPKCVSLALSMDPQKYVRYISSNTDTNIIISHINLRICIINKLIQFQIS